MVCMYSTVITEELIFKNKYQERNSHMKKDDMIKIILQNVRLNLVMKRLLQIGVSKHFTLDQLGEYLKKNVTNVEMQRILDLIEFEKRW